MESRLPRFRLVDDHLKDNLLSSIPSCPHSGPQLKSCNSGQLLQDSGSQVVFSKGLDVTKKLNQETCERGDSKIPVYVTLAKSSSIQDGGQRIQFSEQQTAHESKQDRLASVEMCTSSRVQELKHKFEAFEVENGNRKLERQNIRKGYTKNHNFKDEHNKKKTDSPAPTLKPNELLRNKNASASEKPDLAAVPILQKSISSNSSYRRWNSMYPKSTLSLSTQRPSTVKKKSEELFTQECFDQQLKSCENTHEDCCDVVPESLHEQHPFENKTIPKNEHYLENRNNTTNIDSSDDKSYNYSISLYKRNSKVEAVEKNSSERSLNYNRARQASRKLDEPKVMDGVINPVSRVHSEPLTPSSLVNTSRAKSPRRKIFETKSDKMVSRTVGSGYRGEEEEEEGHDSKDRALYKRRNECQADVHRSLTDHRTEGTNILSSARNKCEVSYRTTASLNDSTESHKGQHQQNDSSDESAAHCLNANSRQEQNDPVRENSHLSGVVKENERVQSLRQEEVDNVDEQKQPHVAELTSPVHNGRLLLTLPLPSSSNQYPGTVDRFCSRPDCSSDRNRLTRRRSTYGSIGDLYVSRMIQMRGMESDYSYGLSPSGVAQSALQKKTWISSPVETSSHCDQLKLLSPSQSLIQLHTKRTKVSCETSESKLKRLEGSATDPIQYLLCCRTTSKEALAAEQVMQTIERDHNSLLQSHNLRHNSPTSFTAKHRTPNKAAAQSSTSVLEDDQQIEEMLIESDDEMSEDKLEVKNNVEFVRSSHQGQIGKSEEIMPCTEFMDLLEEHRPIKQPVRNSLVSVKPENGFVSMYRTQGPIIAKFSGVRVKTVDPIDSKAASGLQRNNSSQARDLYQQQTHASDTCKTPTNQAKPIVRGHSFSKPLTRLTADKGDKYLRRCDNGHQTLFRLQPNFRWPKTQQKRDISPYLHASCSTDSITTDCELNARSLHTQIQHSRDAFRRRHHSDISFKATKTAASACNSALSAGPSANFRTVFRESRQQLAEEQEEEDGTSSVEELVKGNNHPLYLSESESEVDTRDDRNRGCSRVILNSPESTRNGETQLIEQEKTEITRQILIDRNRVLFEETRIFQFRQRICMMLIGVIFILVFYMNIFPIVQSTIFRKSDS